MILFRDSNLPQAKWNWFSPLPCFGESVLVIKIKLLINFGVGTVLISLPVFSTLGANKINLNHFVIFCGRKLGQAANSQYCYIYLGTELRQQLGDLHSNEQTLPTGVRPLKIPPVCKSD